MKTNRIVLMVLVAIIASTNAFAQTKPAYTFKVLVNKGKNEVRAKGVWEPIRTGSTLRTGDEIKLASNAYLGLIHSNGKPLEVKDAGVHKVDDLADRVKGGTSVVNKYTDFLLSTNEEKRNKLTATGAVHRGANTMRIYLPKSESALLYGDEAIIHWERDPSATTYVVSLKSIFGEDLSTHETNDTTLLVNLKDEKYLNEDNITVEVYPKGEPGKRPQPPYYLKKLSTADKDRIRVLMNDLPSEAMDANPLSRSLMAIFFEENRLLIDAAKAYQEAIRLAPDVTQFRDDYELFLLRHAIKEKKSAK